MGDKQPISDIALTLLAAGDSIAPRVLVGVYPIEVLETDPYGVQLLMRAQSVASSPSSPLPPRVSPSRMGAPSAYRPGPRRASRHKSVYRTSERRVQPCIRPLDAAVLAAGPDVIR